MPPHLLTIKTNSVFRLLRNFSLDLGLVKNVHVVIINVGTRIVTVRFLRGMSGATGIYVDSEDILIPRISFSAALPSGHTLMQRQFPLAPAYSTTLNSCQGLTLDIVGVDLRRPIFSHGQLYYYTALSRIRNQTHARLLFRPGEILTTNVTYHEILV
ncbi:hypothetical protein DFH08DRAFT_699237 [Mycena albidolilacea]|uniref:ATP-dependent DNA helicase n=1 Tax=Mycena albidolilacea TaxID=1033008 RepID=A0AAD7ES46_9AGAR|nr:hypothetical protein DFH08DRAFT_699237 [Mycena albidolilacea]